MNKTSSIEQLSETQNLEAYLILRQNNLDPMSRFIELKSNILNLTQKQIVQQ